MQQGSLKIYFLISDFKKRIIPILIIAIFIAIFCLPKISSFAYDLNFAKEYFYNIQRYVSQQFEPKVRTMEIYVTAYSSTPEETDDTPCIAASGYDLCKHNKENVIACNFLPLGAKIKFPELDPDKIYTVVDRMHERFNSRMDIWMTSHEKASAFGKKYLTVEIIK